MHLAGAGIVGSTNNFLILNMKTTINIILLVICSSVFSQLTYDEKNQIAQEIFDSFDEKYIKSSFVLIWNDDTKAINQSKIKFPNPNDFMKQIDYQRELEQTFRTKWYNKQKWFKSLKYSKEDNSSIAYNVRAKISGFSLRNNYDEIPELKKQLLK